MSTIPKARRSNITGLTVTPDVWDSYPELSRSTIINCTFKNLGATTSISRSTMSDSSVLQEESLLSATAETTKSKAKNGTSIERSTVDKCQIISPSTVSRSQITNCTVVESTVDRGKLVNCTVSAQSNVDRTTAQTSRFVGAKLVRRSVLSDSVVMGESRVGRSAVNDSVVGDKAVIEQTALENAVITRSRVERSRISNCDVMDCEIQRTDFTGMILQYGIWKNGDLVGRTSTQHEVVIKPREKSASSKGVAEGLSTSSAEQPVQNPGSGWKAAEAAWESLGVESDYEKDEEEGDSLSDNLEESGNDEPFNSSSKRKMKQSLHQNSGQDTSTAGSGADINDPPPPYKQ